MTLIQYVKPYFAVKLLRDVQAIARQHIVHMTSCYCADRAFPCDFGFTEDGGICVPYATMGKPTPAPTPDLVPSGALSTSC